MATAATLIGSGRGGVRPDATSAGRNETRSSTRWVWGVAPTTELDFLYEGRGPEGVADLRGHPRHAGALRTRRRGRARLHPPAPRRARASRCIVTSRPRRRSRWQGKIVEVWDKEKSAVIGVGGRGRATTTARSSASTRRSCCSARAASVASEAPANPETHGAARPRARRGDHPRGAARASRDLPDVGRQQPDAHRPRVRDQGRLRGARSSTASAPSDSSGGPYWKDCAGATSRSSARCGAGFADQVWPGDQIITKQWFGGDGSAIVESKRKPTGGSPCSTRPTPRLRTGE